jgi:hypothetical protein
VAVAVELVEVVVADAIDGAFEAAPEFQGTVVWLFVLFVESIIHHLLILLQQKVHASRQSMMSGISASGSG